MGAGHKIEGIVEELCAKSFFADFTYRSPKYRKSNGQEKEAADILVVFDAVIIIIQVKFRKLTAPEGEISDVDLKRFVSSVDRGFKQFRSFAEAIARPDFKSFTNGRGVEIEFDKLNVKKLVFIVVSASTSDIDEGESAKVRWSNTCLFDEESPVPIHLFCLDQFRVLMTLADTISDFMSMLECRWILRAGKLIQPHADPIDEWFLITFEKQRILNAAEANSPIEVEGLRDVHSESLEKLEEMERSSYLIDFLIDGLSQAVGTEMPIHDDLRRFAKFLFNPNSMEANRRLIPLLARLNREERRNLADAYFVRADRCIDEGREFSFGALIFPAHEEAYLVLGSILELEQTQVIAFNLGRIFCRKFGKSRVVVVHGCKGSISDLPVGVILVDASEGMNDDLGPFEIEDAFSAPVEVQIG